MSLSPLTFFSPVPNGPILCVSECLSFFPILALKSPITMLYLLLSSSYLVTTGKFEGKRSRGRQREKIMDRLATWHGPGKVSDILAAVKDRDLWRDMIANAYKQGT
ncbi:hypothetical protein PoB_000248500 [Plakobranchus ocellatus]|uniref:Uncharacterized protein n=1 Tax=Plakobranchus ocellatus TaxID=259542 RepID=A0AAV3XYT1_9GAST|nr:hypothetical protein PoB_000248500 [Plakobranchus ocellatus]